MKKGNKTGLKHSDSHSDAKPQYKSKVLDETELVAHVREGEWIMEFQGIKVLHNFFSVSVLLKALQFYITRIDSS